MNLAFSELCKADDENDNLRVQRTGNKIEQISVKHIVNTERPSPGTVKFPILLLHSFQCYAHP